jgi:hypothetical protein
MDKNEYTFFGQSMENISVVYGILLIVWGVGITLISGSDSFTSLIPAVLGVPVLIFGILSIVFPNKKKLFMHIVVTVGLIIFLGGLDFLRSLGDPFQNVWADTSKLMLMISGFIFTFLCIKSFIFARKNK